MAAVQVEMAPPPPPGALKPKPKPKSKPRKERKGFMMCAGCRAELPVADFDLKQMICISDELIFGQDRCSGKVTVPGGLVERTSQRC